MIRHAIWRVISLGNDMKRDVFLSRRTVNVDTRDKYGHDEDAQHSRDVLRLLQGNSAKSRAHPVRPVPVLSTSDSIKLNLRVPLQPLCCGLASVANTIQEPCCRAAWRSIPVVSGQADGHVAMKSSNTSGSDPASTDARSLAERFAELKRLRKRVDELEKEKRRLARSQKLSASRDPER